MKSNLAPAQAHGTGAAVDVIVDPRVSAAVSGDRAAASALLMELLPRMRNLIRYLIRGDQLVDDIAQEAMIAVLRGLPTYRAEGSLRSWADRIVARVALGWARRDRRQKGMERESVAQQDPPANVESPEQYLLRRQAVARLDCQSSPPWGQ